LADGRSSPESLLDLAFLAIKELTDETGEQWVLLELLKKHPRGLLELSMTMRKDFGYSYDYISAVTTRLVRKGLAVRPVRGKYEPNYKPILMRMMVVSGKS